MQSLNVPIGMRRNAASHLFIQYLNLNRRDRAFHRGKLVRRQMDVEAAHGVRDGFGSAHADQQAHVLELRKRPRLDERGEAAAVPFGQRFPEPERLFERAVAGGIDPRVNGK